jgi:uncharacterized protein YggE
LRIEEVGRVLDAALAKGANEISGLSLFSSKSDSTRPRGTCGGGGGCARPSGCLGSRSGRLLGSLIELSSAQEPIRPIPRPVIRMTATAAVQMPIASGEQTATATVTARWTFVGGR